MENELTGLQVYKFGGASVKDAAAILNLCRIVRDFGPQGPLLIVVSAMGKTTNALEEIYDLAYHGRDYSAQLMALVEYHQQAVLDIINQQSLSEPDTEVASVEVDEILTELSNSLASAELLKAYDKGYDQIVSYG